MLLDFLRLINELSLRRRVNRLTSGLANSGLSDRYLSVEFKLLWFGLGSTVALVSSMKISSAGLSTVLIPLEAIFSMTSQFSSLILADDVPTSSKDDESELELFTAVDCLWLFEHPLGPGPPSKILWRFSVISFISSSEQLQSSSWLCGRSLCGALERPLVLEVGFGMFKVKCVALKLGESCWRLLKASVRVWGLAAGGDCGVTGFVDRLAFDERGCCVVGCLFCWLGWLKQVVFWKSTNEQSLLNYRLWYIISDNELVTSPW